jgi:hypothetical protein
VANYRLTPVALHAFAKDPADTWSVSLNVPVDGVNMVYRDSLGQVPLVGSGIAVLTAPNARHALTIDHANSEPLVSLCTSRWQVSGGLLHELQPDGHFVHHLVQRGLDRH